MGCFGLHSISTAYEALLIAWAGSVIRREDAGVVAQRRGKNEKKRGKELPFCATGNNIVTCLYHSIQ